jgi:hypothetical protein
MRTLAYDLGDEASLWFQKFSCGSPALFATPLTFPSVENKPV